MVEWVRKSLHIADSSEDVEERRGSLGPGFRLLLRLLPRLFFRLLVDHLLSFWLETSGYLSMTRRGCIPPGGSHAAWSSAFLEQLDARHLPPVIKAVAPPPLSPIRRLNQAYFFFSILGQDPCPNEQWEVMYLRHASCSRTPDGAIY